MIFVMCNQCQHAWGVQGEKDEVERLLSLPEWQESFPCPTPLCGGRAMRSGTCPASRVVPIPLHEFYRAVMGLGNGAPVDLVRKLLLGFKIVAIDAEPCGNPQRTIIQNLTFADGTKMHFGISQKGACIYNVEEVKGEVRTGGIVEGGDSNREETRRSTEVAASGITNKSTTGNGSSGASTIVEPGTESVPNVSTTGDVSTGTVTRDESDSDHSRVRV